MNHYKLLTPGPLTTTETVKKEMMFDHCTWDDDYKKITLGIREKLLNLAQVDEDYTVVLMQGSGTFGVESVLTSVVGEEDKLLIIANGAYGMRMCEIAKHARLNYTLYQEEYNKIPDAGIVQRILEKDKKITHVAMVHSETTSGILNDIEAVAKVVKEEGKTRSLSLDLYEQWETMDKDGKWRFTSPTHTVLAFAKALEELEAEGGIKARNERYVENNRLLIQRMKEMGFVPYIDEKHQGPIITTFYYPAKCRYSFEELYDYVKERGYAIYPGKVTDAETFRIGNIGEIYKEDIELLCGIFDTFLKEKGDKIA